MVDVRSPKLHDHKDRIRTKQRLEAEGEAKKNRETEIAGRVVPCCCFLFDVNSLYFTFGCRPVGRFAWSLLAWAKRSERKVEVKSFLVR